MLDESASEAMLLAGVELAGAELDTELARVLERLLELAMLEATELVVLLLELLLPLLFEPPQALSVRPRIPIESSC